MQSYNNKHLYFYYNELLRHLNLYQPNVPSILQAFALSVTVPFAVPVQILLNLSKLEALNKISLHILSRDFFDFSNKYLQTFQLH